MDVKKERTSAAAAHELRERAATKVELQQLRGKVDISALGQGGRSGEGMVPYQLYGGHPTYVSGGGWQTFGGHPMGPPLPHARPEGWMVHLKAGIEVPQDAPWECKCCGALNGGAAGAGTCCACAAQKHGGAGDGEREQRVQDPLQRLEATGTKHRQEMAEMKARVAALEAEAQAQKERTSAAAAHGLRERAATNVGLQLLREDAEGQGRGGALRPAG